MQRVVPLVALISSN